MRRMRMTEIEELSRKCFCLLGKPPLSRWSFTGWMTLTSSGSQLLLIYILKGHARSIALLGKADGRQPAISPECVGKREEYGNDEKSSMLDYQPALDCSCGPCLVSCVLCLACRVSYVVESSLSLCRLCATRGGTDASQAHAGEKVSRTSFCPTRSIEKSLICCIPRAPLDRWREIDIPCSVRWWSGGGQSCDMHVTGPYSLGERIPSRACDQSMKSSNTMNPSPWARESQF